jgi:hypothetical protein
MTDKEKRIAVAERMKKLCNNDNNPAEAMAFIHDAITLMDLVLKEGDEV